MGSAVMRAVFPQDAARRAFLKSVGASTALAAISQFFPLGAATDVFAQGAGGIEKIYEIRLTAEEHAKLKKSADSVQELVNVLKSRQ